MPRSARAHPPAVLAALLAAGLVHAACSRDGGPGTLNLPREVAPEAGFDPAARLVTAVAPLRREPGEPPKGKGDGKGSPGAAVALLPRGDRVTLLETRDGWSRVRAAGGQEGWTRAAVLVPPASVQEATVLATALAFERPDLLAVNPKRKVEPGALLLVRASKDLFSEADAGPGPPTWVLTDRLSFQPADVAAARLVDRARWLQRSDRVAEARDVLALLRSTLPGSPFVPVLALELGEAPPPADAPAGASGPSGPAAAPGTGGRP